jgi:ABC-type oligopeptide transport system ATPase subunit
MTTLLRAENLVKHFQAVQAVDGVSLELAEGETLALVGESGCGKSTVGRLLLRLIEPTAGKIFFQGKDITGMKEREMRSLRREMQIIFQDPYGSLNPRMTVGDMLEEPLHLHGLYREGRVSELLRIVGLAEVHATRYPHEFSGGQRQRIAIARAPAVEPRLIVATAGVGARRPIRRRSSTCCRTCSGASLVYVFIAHDLAVVKHSARVAAWPWQDCRARRQAFAVRQPAPPPYTRALLSAIPVPDLTPVRKKTSWRGCPEPYDPRRAAVRNGVPTPRALQYKGARAGRRRGLSFLEGDRLLQRRRAVEGGQ